MNEAWESNRGHEAAPDAGSDAGRGDAVGGDPDGGDADGDVSLHDLEGYDPRSYAGSPYAPTAGSPYYGQRYDDPRVGQPIVGQPDPGRPGSGGYGAYPGAQPGGAPYPGAPYPVPPAPQPTAGPSRRRRLTMAVGAGVVAVATIVGVGLASATTSVNGTPVASQQSPSTQSPSTQSPSTGNGSTTTPVTPNDPFGNGGTTSPSNGSGNGGNSTPSSGKATAAQTVGIVDIYTKLGFQQASAAGTGMVIDAGGYVLTNNHVIQGATTIRVVIVSNGRSYRASVVGTAPTEDIAVLKLANATGLTKANLGDSDTVEVGDQVTGVGNAGGAGGTPHAATGSVTSLDNTITASDQSGTNSEKLSGIIATDAPIRSGDSGGPLYNAADEVIGVDTAASTSGRAAGFAIPINSALNVAAQIRKGIETSVIHIGYPAFLGVSMASQPTGGRGALVEQVIPGLPAAKAGLVAGDLITKINRTFVANYTQLRTAVARLNPGDTTSVTYTDSAGSSHTTSVTLITGPAD